MSTRSVSVFLSTLTLALALGFVGCAPGVGAGLGDSAFCSVYDTDNNDLLYENEFSAGLYDDWDTDDDDFLTEDEFEVGIDEYDAFGEWDGYYDTWDTDDDDLLDEDEFGFGFEETGYWDTWDADDTGYLDADECDGIEL